MRFAKLLTATLIPLLALPLAAPAFDMGASTNRAGSVGPAQGRSQSLTRSEVRNDEVRIDLRMRRPGEERQSRMGSDTWRVGERALVCFEVSADGYVTVWHQDMLKGEKLIYPNTFSHPKNDRAEPVKGGQQYCIGHEKFGLSVEPSEAVQKVYVHWTRTLEQAVPRNARLKLEPPEEEVVESVDEATQSISYSAVNNP